MSVELKNSGANTDSVHVFGSCINGTVSDEKDINIAVISLDFCGFEFSKLFYLLGLTRIYVIPIPRINRHNPYQPDEFERE